MGKDRKCEVTLLVTPLPPATWIAPTLHLCTAHFWLPLGLSSSVTSSVSLSLMPRKTWLLLPPPSLTTNQEWHVGYLAALISLQVCLIPNCGALSTFSTQDSVWHSLLHKCLSFVK